MDATGAKNGGSDTEFGHNVLLGLLWLRRPELGKFLEILAALKRFGYTQTHPLCRTYCKPTGKHYYCRRQLPCFTFGVFFRLYFFTG